MTLQQQITTLSLMIAGGYIIGFFFDGYRVLRGIIKLPKVLVFIIDISFGILSAVLIFSFLLWSNHGQLRAVIILLLIASIWLYYVTLSSVSQRFWSKLYRTIYQLLHIIGKVFNLIIIKPIVLLYRTIIIIFTFLLTLFAAVGLFIKKFATVIFGGLIKISKGTGTRMMKIKKKAGFSSLLKKIFKRRS